MIDVNILENFYEWLIKNRDKIVRENEGNDRAICFIEIPFLMYKMIKDISEKDNLDGIFDELRGNYTGITDFVIFARDNKNKYELVLDVTFDMSNWQPDHGEPEEPYEDYKKLDYM
jgi:hypothetical protein